jgi:ABC-type multidrug transport system fused ATPase/permease subunit
MVVRPGQTFALVGASGSGKSTILSLLQRMYDPEVCPHWLMHVTLTSQDPASILIDGKPINSINIQHLRSRIGLVTQTPVLFPTTM